MLPFLHIPVFSAACWFLLAACYLLNYVKRPSRSRYKISAQCNMLAIYAICDKYKVLENVRKPKQKKTENKKKGYCVRRGELRVKCPDWYHPSVYPSIYNISAFAMCM
ncbi:hypothetical protein B0T09DRAFT_72851 [Sordaria sp. MPI-SDFR-AT-0083]|nr:hypothetical protein B0T09DRAFT_72851 [Sordaria sp. MPI-SDFR-AT-0083]